mgnify:CR=1 FL=1
MTPTDFKFDLGTKVKERITGYTGIIIARSQWIYNCNTYGVKSSELKDGKPMEAVFFDEPSLDLVEPPSVTPKRNTGGPTQAIPQTNR